MDLMDQLQELPQTKEEFTVLVDQLEVQADQILDQEEIIESQLPNPYWVWSNVHVSQIFKMSKTQKET